MAWSSITSSLRKAIRGAGRRIGIVVEFTFKVHPQPHSVWTSTISFATDKLPDIVDSLDLSLAHPEGRAAAECVLALSPEMTDAVGSQGSIFSMTLKKARGIFRASSNWMPSPMR
ncbi:hypothetical protein ETB97_005699 [Aspergillus alliaceus]|uniref:Uncharacterized protein n=1 Tax=Petromyces alliaceus TaxID=209559 RepID=A0A8H6E2W1_PETAA|nr:hypothetical protein ETB97_005699 [Aspergillus burnettii]